MEKVPRYSNKYSSSFAAHVGVVHVRIPGGIQLYATFLKTGYLVYFIVALAIAL